MLRITTHTEDDELRLTLEGCVTGEWVPELDACWRNAVGTLSGRRLHVDLSAVWFVDRRGRELMAEMYRTGARFVTSGCVMPEVVREIAQTEAAPPEPGQRS